MRVLLVGAGAVGQVYGYYLQQAGWDVSFLVKEKYAMSMRKGLTLYTLNRGTAWVPRVFRGYSTLFHLSEVRKNRWDQVWLCVSSTALDGEWLEPLLEAIGETTLISLQPGVDDQVRLAEAVGKERLVSGLIGFLSYQAPIESEPVEQVGMAVYCPPFVPSVFSGPKSPVSKIVRALRKAGLPARAHRNVSIQMAQGSAILMPLVVGLEASGWSFSRFRGSDTMALACDAAQEAQQIVARFHGVRRPLWRIAIRSGVMGLVLRIASRVVPLPFETYLRVHFTKVGDQSRKLMQSYLRIAGEKGVAVDAIPRLVAELDRVHLAGQPADEAESWEK